MTHTKLSKTSLELFLRIRSPETHICIHRGMSALVARTLKKISLGQENCRSDVRYKISKLVCVHFQIEIILEIIKG